MTSPDLDARLRAAADSPEHLQQLRARLAEGEPLAYVLGQLEFRQRRFLMDKRAYITDPEASFFVDTVNAQGRELALRLGRPPRVLDFGVGAGTLGISIQLENPDWILTGLDLDAAALELARDNLRLHSVDIDLIESDYLSGWPADRAPPDLVFGDPPWGDGADLYDGERDESYYRQMPVLSAFPPGGGRTTIHDELIRRFVAMRWPSLLLLNYGILPRELIERSAAPLGEWQLLHPRPELTVLVGRA